MGSKYDISDPEVRVQFGMLCRGQIPANECRALTVTGFGVVAPQQFYDRMVSKMKSYAGVREAGATILTTADGSDLPIAYNDDVANSATLVAEGATNNSSVDPDVSNVVTKPSKFDSDWIKVSYEYVQDSKLPYLDVVADIAAKRIGRALNPYTTTGTGTDQPEGFVTAGEVGKTAAEPNTFTFEELIDLLHSLDPAYRSRAVWQTNDAVLKIIRKMKDDDDRYIFNSDLNTILGYRYVVNNDMAATLEANAKPIAFGDFSAYVLRDVVPTIVVTRELFVNSGNVGFRVFSRHDGRLVDPAAVQLLQMASS